MLCYTGPYNVALNKLRQTVNSLPNTYGKNYDIRLYSYHTIFWLRLSISEFIELQRDDEEQKLSVFCQQSQFPFSGNTIQTVSGLDYDKLTNLVSLELRGNLLKTTDGIYLPNLRRLYLVRWLYQMFGECHKKSMIIVVL